MEIEQYIFLCVVLRFEPKSLCCTSAVSLSYIPSQGNISLKDQWFNLIHKLKCKWKHSLQDPLGCTEVRSKKEVHNCEYLH